MRRTLVAAVALAPLCLVAGAASAQTAITAPVDTVSNGITTPIATATALNNAPADIDVTGSVSVSTVGTSPYFSGTPAVTLNSDNEVSNAGAISISNLNNSAAILAVGGTGVTGSGNQNIIITGTVANADGFSASTNGDGLIEEPYSTVGSVNRYGILVTGSGALQGSINNSGTVTVGGNNSAGIFLQAPITGALTSAGTISVTGDGSTGIASSQGATIGGGVVISGAITTLGQATPTSGTAISSASAINLQGDVDGRIAIYSAISSTGYASTTRASTSSSLTSIQQTAGTTNTQVGQSSGAVIIGGNVTGGILIGAPPVGTSTSTSLTQDLDGDGIPDVAEGSGSVTNYGSAPALTVGGTGNTTIGVVGSTNADGSDGEVAADGTPLPQPADAYGIIIRGAVSGEGIYDGVSATGLAIGGQGGTVKVLGGVRVVGSVSADSFEAAATAIHVGGGANVPVLDNEDFIEASISHSALTTTSTAMVAATGVLIDKSATLPSIVNYGTIQASANGDNMSAYGIRDLSGLVTSVVNDGLIGASVTPITTCMSTCSTVAVDLSASTSNISFVQQANPHPIAVDVTTTTTSSGVVSTTAALSTTTATTTVTTTTTTAGITTTTTTTTPVTPQIVGDVLLGSGTNTVQILAGTVTGALSLGGGVNDSLTIGNATSAAVYDGALTNINGTVPGTGLALAVNNGVLFNTATGTLNLSTLSIGNASGTGSGVLYAAIDPANGAQALYNASGAATIYANGQLGIVLKTPLQTTQTYTVVTAAGGLNSAVPAASLLTTDVPYLITGSASETGNSISVTLTPKTAAQLGLNPSESAALTPILNNLPNDAGIQSAVLGAYTQASFLKSYQQLLPDYSGGVFQLALAASDSVTRATSRVNDIQNPSGTRGAWAEEVAFGVNKNADSQAAGYQGGGFGFVGGVETGGLGLGAFGLTGSFLTGDVKDPHAPGDNLQSFSEGEGGAYWQAQLGGFRGDARVGAGYVDYSERREFVLTDSTGAATIDRSARGNSTGYTLTGHLGLGYQTPQVGLFYFRPQVHGDYFRLQQGSYTERYGGDGFDLSLASRTGDESSGTVSLVTGMSFGSGFQWRPELELGYRDVFTGNAGDTTAQYTVSGATPFTLLPANIRGGGPVGRLDVKADTDFYELNFEAGAEQRVGLVSADLRISVRVLF